MGTDIKWEEAYEILVDSSAEPQNLPIGGVHSLAQLLLLDELNFVLCTSYCIQSVYPEAGNSRTSSRFRLTTLLHCLPCGTRSLRMGN